MDKFLI